MIDVLIVDDEPGVVALQSKWLRRLGYQCRSADCLRLVVEAVLAVWPAVVLLDLNLMSDAINGWQVWDELERLAAGRPLRVIVTSGKAVDEADRQEIRRRGGRLVRKVEGKEKLVTAVRALLARPAPAVMEPESGPTSGRVLIVEDEPVLAASYQKTLEAEGYQTWAVAQGEEALLAFRIFAPDLVLLDIKLAGRLNGFDVLRTIRAENEAVRVVIITNQRKDESQLLGLTGGADDYVVKAITPGLLLARVQAQLRRAPIGVAVPVQRGDVRIDLAHNLVFRRDRLFALGENERRVLGRLMQTPEQTVTLNELSLAGWGLALPQPATDVDLAPLEGCIYRLRDKLGSDLIWNTRGGYMLALPDETAEQSEAIPDGPSHA